MKIKNITINKNDLRIHLFKGMLKTIFVLFFMVTIGTVTFSQHFEGSVLCAKSADPVDFVNIGVVGTALGTVSDGNGRFSLSIADRFNEDTIKFSKIGYRTKSLLVREFKELVDHNIFLTPESYSIQEVQVRKTKRKARRYGTFVDTDDHKSFAINELGLYRFWPHETGVIIDVNRRVVVRSIHFNVHLLTFDKVNLELNVYSIIEGKDTILQSLLEQPLLVAVNKEDVRNDQLYWDVSDLGLAVENKALVTVKLIDFEGEGYFSIRTNLFIDRYFFRPSGLYRFKAHPGQMGIYFYGDKI